MQDNHITSLFSDKALRDLSEHEIATAESHVARCPECKRAYEAARISQALIQARTSETIDVGPFFATRVMAALRERELSPEEPALMRLWRAAGALVSTMAVLLAILVGLTAFDPNSNTQSTAIAASQDLYSPESVVLEDQVEDDDVLYDEVIVAMYDLGDADEQ